MTTHLFSGHPDGTAVVVTSGITRCCRAHTLGLPKGDTGTIDVGACDCPELLARADDHNFIRDQKLPDCVVCELPEALHREHPWPSVDADGSRCFCEQYTGEHNGVCNSCGLPNGVGL